MVIAVQLAALAVILAITLAAMIHPAQADRRARR